MSNRFCQFLFDECSNGWWTMVKMALGGINSILLKKLTQNVIYMYINIHICNICIYVYLYALKTSNNNKKQYLFITISKLPRYQLHTKRLHFKRIYFNLL